MTINPQLTNITYNRKEQNSKYQFNFEYYEESHLQVAVSYWADLPDEPKPIKRTVILNQVLYNNEPAYVGGYVTIPDNLAVDLYFRRELAKQYPNENFDNVNFQLVNIQRIMPYAQYVHQPQGYSGPTLEIADDKIVMLTQQLNDRLTVLETYHVSVEAIHVGGSLIPLDYIPKSTGSSNSFVPSSIKDDGTQVTVENSARITGDAHIEGAGNIAGNLNVSGSSQYEGLLLAKQDIHVEGWINSNGNNIQFQFTDAKDGDVVTLELSNSNYILKNSPAQSGSGGIGGSVGAGYLAKADADGNLINSSLNETTDTLVGTKSVDLKQGLNVDGDTTLNTLTASNNASVGGDLSLTGYLATGGLNLKFEFENINNGDLVAIKQENNYISIHNIPSHGGGGGGISSSVRVNYLSKADADGNLVDSVLHETTAGVLTCEANFTINQNLNVIGQTTVSTINATGDALIGGDLTVNKDAHFLQDIDLTGMLVTGGEKLNFNFLNINDGDILSLRRETEGHVTVRNVPAPTGGGEITVTTGHIPKSLGTTLGDSIMQEVGGILIINGDTETKGNLKIDTTFESGGHKIKFDLVNVQEGDFLIISKIDPTFFTIKNIVSDQPVVPPTEGEVTKDIGEMAGVLSGLTYDITTNLITVTQGSGVIWHETEYVVITVTQNFTLTIGAGVPSDQMQYIKLAYVGGNLNIVVGQLTPAAQNKADHSKDIFLGNFVLTGTAGAQTAAVKSYGYRNLNQRPEQLVDLSTQFFPAAEVVEIIPRVDGTNGNKYIELSGPVIFTPFNTGPVGETADKYNTYKKIIPMFDANIIPKIIFMDRRGKFPVEVLDHFPYPFKWVDRSFWGVEAAPDYAKLYYGLFLSPEFDLYVIYSEEYFKHSAPPNEEVGDIRHADAWLEAMLNRRLIPYYQIEQQLGSEGEMLDLRAMNLAPIGVLFTTNALTEPEAVNNAWTGIRGPTFRAVRPPSNTIRTGEDSSFLPANPFGIWVTVNKIGEVPTLINDGTYYDQNNLYDGYDAYFKYNMDYRESRQGPYQLSSRPSAVALGVQGKVAIYTGEKTIGPSTYEMFDNPVAPGSPGQDVVYIDAHTLGPKSATTPVYGPVSESLYPAHIGSVPGDEFATFSVQRIIKFQDRLFDYFTKREVLKLDGSSVKARYYPTLADKTTLVLTAPTQPVIQQMNTDYYEPVYQQLRKSKFYPGQSTNGYLFESMQNANEAEITVRISKIIYWVPVEVKLIKEYKFIYTSVGPWYRDCGNVFIVDEANDYYAFSYIDKDGPEGGAALVKFARLSTGLEFHNEPTSSLSRWENVVHDYLRSTSALIIGGYLYMFYIQNYEPLNKVIVLMDKVLINPSYSVPFQFVIDRKPINFLNGNNTGVLSGGMWARKMDSSNILILNSGNMTYFDNALYDIRTDLYVTGETNYPTGMDILRQGFFLDGYFCMSMRSNATTASDPKARAIFKIKPGTNEAHEVYNFLPNNEIGGVLEGWVNLDGHPQSANHILCMDNSMRIWVTSDGGSSWVENTQSKSVIRFGIKVDDPIYSTILQTISSTVWCTEHTLDYVVAGIGYYPNAGDNMSPDHIVTSAAYQTIDNDVTIHLPNKGAENYIVTGEHMYRSAEFITGGVITRDVPTTIRSKTVPSLKAYSLGVRTLDVYGKPIKLENIDLDPNDQIAHIYASDRYGKAGEIYYSNYGSRWSKIGAVDDIAIDESLVKDICVYNGLAYVSTKGYYKDIPDNETYRYFMRVESINSAGAVIPIHEMYYNYSDYQNDIYYALACNNDYICQITTRPKIANRIIEGITYTIYDRDNTANKVDSVYNDSDYIKNYTFVSGLVTTPFDSNFYCFVWGDKSHAGILVIHQDSSVEMTDITDYIDDYYAGTAPNPEERGNFELGGIAAGGSMNPASPHKSRLFLMVRYDRKGQLEVPIVATSLLIIDYGYALNTPGHVTRHDFDEGNHTSHGLDVFYRANTDPVVPNGNYRVILTFREKVYLSEDSGLTKPGISYLGDTGGMNFQGNGSKLFSDPGINNIRLIYSLVSQNLYSFNYTETVYQLDDGEVVDLLEDRALGDRIIAVTDNGYTLTKYQYSPQWELKKLNNILFNKNKQSLVCDTEGHFYLLDSSNNLWVSYYGNYEWNLALNINTGEYMGAMFHTGTDILITTAGRTINIISIDLLTGDLIIDTTQVIANLEPGEEIVSFDRGDENPNNLFAVTYKTTGVSRIISLSPAINYWSTANLLYRQFAAKFIGIASHGVYVLVIDDSGNYYFSKDGGKTATAGGKNPDKIYTSVYYDAGSYSFYLVSKGIDGCVEHNTITDILLSKPWIKDAVSQYSGNLGGKHIINKARTLGVVATSIGRILTKEYDPIY